MLIFKEPAQHDFILRLFCHFFSSKMVLQEEDGEKEEMPKVPFMYELYAILIHSGNASGGHYYAYIKDFTSGHWFCFNDQSVSRVNSL
jgi:ubiquitin C-terminal hydrolase